MNKIKDALSRFMAGRYGTDQLNYALLVLYIVLVLINAFVSNGIVSFIISFLTLAMLIFVIFRMFSRNTYKRSSENEAFLNVWNKIKAFFVRIFNSRNKKYVKCPHCHAQLKFPRIKGKHKATCPQCGERFDVNITFGSSKK